jgi:hypothetical protein
MTAPPWYLFSMAEPYHAFAQRYTRARGEHGLKMIGTLQALGLGGMYQRPKMGVYVDNNGRQGKPTKSRWRSNSRRTRSNGSSSASGARGPTPPGSKK